MVESQFSEGGFWERGGWHFSESVAVFTLKDKLKSQTFNDKKNLSEKMFSSVITKNLNWEILTESLVTLKIGWDYRWKILTWRITEKSDF